MRRALVLVGVLAFLVGLAFLVARPPVPDPAATPYAGVRGGARDKAAGLAVLYRRAGSERPLEPGTVLAGGDVLRFVFKGERPRYLELRVRTPMAPFARCSPKARVPSPCGRVRPYRWNSRWARQPVGWS